jgi:hypothetical protein
MLRFLLLGDYLRLRIKDAPGGRSSDFTAQCRIQDKTFWLTMPMPINASEC